MWTDEIIARLIGFCEHRDFRVEYHGHKIAKVDPRMPEHGESGWAAYHYSHGDGDADDDHTFDDPNELEETKLEDWKVYPLRPLPNWWERDVPGLIEDDPV